mgnify:CR=1 FL=1
MHVAIGVVEAFGHAFANVFAFFFSRHAFHFFVQVSVEGVTMHTTATATVVRHVVPQPAEHAAEKQPAKN